MLGLKGIIVLWFFVIEIYADYLHISKKCIYKYWIIGEKREYTITSCYMECVSRKDCMTVATRNDPALYVLHHCFLLAMNERREDKDLSTDELFVLTKVRYIFFCVF